MNPQVSVLLPYFNSEETLSDSIESILNQNFTDLELVLIDINSSGNSCEIAAQYAAQDKRVYMKYTERKDFICDARFMVSHINSEASQL